MQDLKKIMIVEDEAPLRDLYSEYLTSSGYHVGSFSNGKLALESAKSDHYDLFLLDIMVPSLDGVSLLKVLKEDPKLSDKPVIMITQLDTEHLITECFDHGADAYLIKAQITPDKILNEVEQFL